MDNVVLNPGAGGQIISTDDIAGVQHQYVKMEFGVDGVAIPVSTADPLPVTVLASVLPTNAATAANQQTDALTDAELRASPVVISGTVTANTGLTQPLTDAQLRATPVPISGTVTADTGLTQPLTDAQLRASAVPVIQAAPTTPINGHTTVTTAGTRVVLAGSTTVKSVTIKALGANTGIIYVGDSGVTSANGFQLYARDSVSMDISNLNTIYIDSSVSGEGVAYIAVN